MQRKNTLSLLVAPLLFLLLIGCRTNRHDLTTGGQVKTVRVTVEGEVKNRGTVELDQDFTKESFLAAVGGFTYGSYLGATPTHFYLKRRNGDRWEEWRIKFSEMPDYKAKGFAFEAGDNIRVPRLLF
jgi:hypothetical protein